MAEKNMRKTEYKIIFTASINAFFVIVIVGCQVSSDMCDDQF